MEHDELFRLINNQGRINSWNSNKSIILFNLFKKDRPSGLSRDCLVQK